MEVTQVSEFLPGFAERERPAAGRTWHTEANEEGNYIVAAFSSGRYQVAASKPAVGLGVMQVLVRFGTPGIANLTLSNAAGPVQAGSCEQTAAGGESKISSAIERGIPVAADSSVGRLLRWLRAVRFHDPGCNDPPASLVGGWSRLDLEMLVRDVRELLGFLQRADRSLSRENERSRLVFVIDGFSLTLDELERFYFGGEPLTGNAMLRRAAVLHADAAMFIRGNLPGQVLVADGRSRGERPATLHWAIGRSLLDYIVPSPNGDSGALLWYRAVSAHLLQTGKLEEAQAHLQKARQIFPQEAAFALDSAFLHQELASPAVQSSLGELRAAGLNPAVASRSGELQNAEQFLHQTVALEPANATARLRLGETLGTLGQHDEAVAQLQRAIALTPDRRDLYLAELFLGREQQAQGNTSEAKRRYQNAAALYPTAQSPRLALAHLARESGNRAAAFETIHSVITAIAVSEEADPWWGYYEPHSEDAATFLAEMYRQLAEGGRR